MEWCRQLWARLKVVATAHLEAQAKQKAKQALEIADAVAQEERVALQQYQLSFPTTLCCCLLQRMPITTCQSINQSNNRLHFLSLGLIRGVNSLHVMARLAAADLI